MAKPLLPVVGVDRAAQRGPRSRASIACQACRSRKSCCDVEKRHPCTRCWVDEGPCRVITRKVATKSRKKNSPAASLSARSQSRARQSANIEKATIKTMPVNSAAARVDMDQFGQPLQVELPRFIAPLTSPLAVQNWEFLTRYKVFDLPSSELSSELLRCFVEFVHPFMPILDLEDFLVCIAGGSSSTQQISLLLYHAVIYASITFVDVTYLRSYGYVSKRSARHETFQKVRLLYHFETDQSRVSTLQALLLMTTWYERPDQIQDAWHWLSLAITQAKALGMHLMAPSGPRDDNASNRLWKRIWWACYVRDRIIAVGLRRPLHISDHDFTTPLLYLGDHNLKPLPQELTRMVGQAAAVSNPVTMQRLAKMNVELTRLCRHLGQVLQLQFSVSVPPPGSAASGGLQRKSRHTECLLKEDLACNNELEAWYQDITPESRYFALGSGQVNFSRDEPETVVVHSAVLMTLYHLTNITLHRSRFLAGSDQASSNSPSSWKTRFSAQSTVQIYRDIMNRGLVQYLPHTGVACLVPAALVHLMDAKSTDKAARSIAHHNTEFCLQALRHLREMYASADFALAYISRARSGTAKSPTRRISISDSSSQMSTPAAVPVEVLLSSMTVHPEEKAAIYDWIEKNPRPTSSAPLPDRNVSLGAKIEQPQASPCFGVADNDESFTTWVDLTEKIHASKKDHRLPSSFLGTDDINLLFMDVDPPTLMGERTLDSVERMTDLENVAQTVTSADQGDEIDLALWTALHDPTE